MSKDRDLLRAVADYIVAESPRAGDAAKAKIKKTLGEMSAPPVSANEGSQLEPVIHRLLLDLGTPCHLRGYDYLVKAIEIVVGDPKALEGVTKVLYPDVAKAFGTTPSRAERAIRHVIEVCWERGNWETLNEHFGNTVDIDKGKPTNSEFIARVALAIRQKMA